MDDRELLTEIRELRHALQAAVIVLVSQKIQSEHPHRPVRECQAKALEIMQEAIELTQSVAQHS